MDPDNRLVARELERQWEQRLTELPQLEDDYARFGREQPRHLTAQDRERIVALAQDLPALWPAETTTAADRRAVVRQLIERVVVRRCGDGEKVEVLVRWRGRRESRHEVHQGLRRYDQRTNSEELKGRVAALRGGGRTGEQIAAVLNREGYRPPRGGSFTGDRVRRLFMLFGLAGVAAGVHGLEGLPGRNAWWLPDLAAERGVKSILVHRWRWSGCVHARQLPGDNGRWIIWADSEERRRLRRLRKHAIRNRGRGTPEDLRQPKPRANEKRCRKQRDNDRTE